MCECIMHMRTYAHDMQIDLCVCRGFGGLKPNNQVDSLCVCVFSVYLKRAKDLPSNLWIYVHPGMNMTGNARNSLDVSAEPATPFLRRGCRTLKPNFFDGEQPGNHAHCSEAPLYTALTMLRAVVAQALAPIAVAERASASEASLPAEPEAFGTPHFSAST